MNEELPPDIQAAMREAIRRVARRMQYEAFGLTPPPEPEPPGGVAIDSTARVIHQEDEAREPRQLPPPPEGGE